jgi:hypothetical protein
MWTIIIFEISWTNGYAREMPLPLIIAIASHKQNNIRIQKMVDFGVTRGDLFCI